MTPGIVMRLFGWIFSLTFGGLGVFMLAESFLRNGSLAAYALLFLGIATGIAWTLDHSPKR